MPRYTYQCKNCKHKFTKLVSRKDKAGEELNCPQCNANNLKRVFTGGAAVQTSTSNNSCSTGTCSTCPTCS